MMSLGYIQQLSREAAERAAAEEARPFVYFNVDEVDAYDHRFPFPFLGDYVPEGWEEVDRYFVDSSGFGLPGEPALTGEQFAQVVRDTVTNERGVGWAIVEAGQFQVYVGKFRKVEAA